ncbi:MAG: serine hydrolase [Oscillospiraceae bacterium]|jgi:D-alanyl-D-alanine carboxypeptidase (penicillin-binding protein 5/6)|nr:serine hydrolase [Oscillospiraceae bacterium]
MLKRIFGVMCAVLLLLLCVYAVFFFRFDAPARSEVAPTPTAAPPTATPTPPKLSVPDTLEIQSVSAVLMRLGGEILFDKNGGKRVYPASLTKIMTAVVALENLDDLNELITLRRELYADIYTTHASVAGFEAGDEASVSDLLYGLMLPSGAECAYALAERVAGTIPAFTELMNDKAEELGMDGTHFVNATGLHDDNHYSTAWDMAALLEYALQNGTFYELFTAKSHIAAPTKSHPVGLAFESLLFSNVKNPVFPGGELLGGKTGYTNEAELCLASLAERDGERLILITCGAPDLDKSRTANIADALLIYGAVAQG